MSAPSPATGRSRNGAEGWCRALPGVLLAAGAMAVYLGSLANGFVYDDHAQVAGNPWLRSLGSLPEVFSTHVWGFEPGPVTNYYRPVMHVFNMVVFQIAGPSPAAYHLASIALHAAACLLFFAVVSRALEDSGAPDAPRSSLAPFLAAALFAVHPVHMEAVAWIGASPDLLYSCFALASLRFHQGLPRLSRESRAGAWSSAAAFFLAMLSKETAVVVPLLVVAYDRQIRGEPWSALRGEALGRYGPHLLALAGYLLLRVSALGALVPVEGPSSGHLVERVAGAFQSFGWYLERLVLPVGYNFLPSPRAPASLLDSSLLRACVAVGILGGVWLVASRRSRLVAWAGLVLCLPLLPPLATTALKAPVAERYLYLPCAGFCAAVAWLGSPRGKMAQWTLAAWGLALLGAGVTTASRVPLLVDDYTLWSHTTARSPESGEAHAWLATALFWNGRVDEGLAEAQRAVALGVDEPDNHYNIGRALEMQGRPDEAVAAYGRAIALNPADAAAHDRLGRLYLYRGEPESALRHFLAAVELAPSDASAQHGLGSAYEAAGMPGEALRAFEAALRLAPGRGEWSRDVARARNALESRTGRP